MISAATPIKKKKVRKLRKKRFFWDKKKVKKRFLKNFLLKLLMFIYCLITLKITCKHTYSYDKTLLLQVDMRSGTLFSSSNDTFMYTWFNALQIL